MADEAASSEAAASASAGNIKAHSGIDADIEADIDTQSVIRGKFRRGKLRRGSGSGSLNDHRVLDRP